MFRKNKNQELENSISRLTCALNQLKCKADSDEAMNLTYNRLLIERAALRKKIANPGKNVLVSFCEKLKNKSQEKIISDYFKS